MFRLLFTSLFLIYSMLTAQSNSEFDKYFYDMTLRVDFIFNSNYEKDEVRIDGLYQYVKFAGSTVNLIDPFDMGKYFVKLYEEETNKLIYSRGFTGLVSEYKITEPALKGIQKEFFNSALLPLPKESIVLTLERRTRDNKLVQFFSEKINPKEPGIRPRAYNGKVETANLLINGSTHDKVDFVFVAEGYSDKDKFLYDAEKFKNILMSQEPFASNIGKFNFRIVYATPSGRSDNILFEDTKLKTVVNTNFETLGMNGYLGTKDYKSVMDVTAGIPADHIIILVNSERFGGNGIYNHFCMTTTDHPNSAKIFLHELGHSFAGLADEYYEDFYSGLQAEYYFPKDVEPLEPNITINADPETIKWKSLLSKGIDVPTKWNKEVIDSLQINLIKEQIEIEKEVSKMDESGVDNGVIGEKRSSMFASLENEADEFKKLYNKKKKKFEGKIGVFEGAAHYMKGFYRPSFICIMNKTGYDKFCAVCQAAFQRMIDYYTK